MGIINEAIYKKMKENYGVCSSWAVWDLGCDSGHTYDLNGKGYALNTMVKTLNEDLTNRNIAELGLHNDVVLVALNFGQREESKAQEFAGINRLLVDIDHANFHEELNIYKYSGDSRQKLAYNNTPIWGSYMTDLIKYNKSGILEPFADSNSASENLNGLLKDEQFMSVQVDGLIKELLMLESTNLTILAVGGTVYNQLKTDFIRKKIQRALGIEVNVFKIDHYSRSNTISDEKYVDKVHKAISILNIEKDK